MLGKSMTFMLQNVFITWNGLPIIGGGGESAFVKVEPDGPGWVTRRGVHGEMQRSRSYASSSGRVTISQLYGVTNNATLDAQKQLDYLTGLGKGALSITDGNGGVSIFASDAFIEGDPAIELSEQPTDQEWILVVTGLVIRRGALRV